MGTFVISKRQNGYYKYEFTSRKGKVIFTSNDFELRFECEDDIEILKKSLDKIIFMKFKSKNGKLYFKVILNEKEIAVSRRYTTLLLLEKGMNDVLKYSPQSEVLDFTNQFIDFDS
jgi:uncharacterized protein